MVNLVQGYGVSHVKSCRPEILAKPFIYRAGQRRFEDYKADIAAEGYKADIAAEGYKTAAGRFKAGIAAGGYRRRRY